MVEKKKYVKPAVESEEAMEQTSLACALSIFPMGEGCDWGTNLSSIEMCETSPFKGGNFSPDLPECSAIPAETRECFVVLS